MYRKPTPFSIQRYLRGLSYPTSRRGLIVHARSHGAGLDVLRALMTLDERTTYESPIQVAMAVRHTPQHLMEMPSARRAAEKA